MAKKRRWTAPRLISWWWVVWGILAVALAVWASTAWLLAQIGSDYAALRIDAIKTGLSVGAGTGGAIALLLAIRRQWLGERAQLHTEEDSRERRITELYGKAADQLGNDKAPVRLAGLYALERLAQNNPDHRQTIVNVICAYLRMPYVPPTAYGGDPGLRSGPTSDLGATEEELQVRLAAQSILTGHLRPHLVYRPGQEDDDPPGPTFWEDIEVDLSRAVLVNFDFARCRARLPDFTSAQFYGSTTFSYCRVLALGLDGAVFHGRAFFHNAVIHGGAFFDDTTFHDDVNLSEINFAGDQARFPAAKFHGTVAFHRSDFRGHIRFDGATFHREVSFRHATFHSGVWFGNWTDEAPYATSVACGDAIFHGPVDFDGVSVLDPAGPNVWPSGWQVAANEDVGTTLERTSASTKPVSPLPRLERSD